MRFEIVLAPEAIEDLRSLPAHIRSGVREALETHLRYEPTKVSKNRINAFEAYRGRNTGLESARYESSMT
jgi:mRNA interferase RelE/StbE